MIPKELLKALRRLEITTNHLATDQLSGNYTSGFKGHSRFQLTDVRLRGMMSPARPSAFQPAKAGSAMIVRSVKAPTVNAFQAWAGLSIGMVSLRAG